MRSKGKPIVKYQLNRKNINDKATKRLVNLPKRVEVDGLTASLRSTAFLQQQHEGIGQLGVGCVDVVWLKLEMKHELQRRQYIPAVIGRGECLCALFVKRQDTNAKPVIVGVTDLIPLVV